MNLVVDLWGILTRAQRRDVLAMQAVSVIMAFSTVIGIAAIAPFFAVLGAPQLIDQNHLLRWLYISGGFTDRHSFVVALGLLFIAVGRLSWREADAPRVPIAVPYAVYAINIVWSMILSVSAGMWPTAIAAIVFSLLPAALAFTDVRQAEA